MTCVLGEVHRARNPQGSNPEDVCKVRKRDFQCALLSALADIALRGIDKDKRDVLLTDWARKTGCLSAILFDCSRCVLLLLQFLLVK